MAGREVEPVPSGERGDASDLRRIKNQEAAKRALEVAVAGGHHLLLIGPPGCGKSLLARALWSLLPAPSVRLSREVAWIYGAAGKPLPPGRPVIEVLPSEPASVVTGGRTRREVGRAILAHGGVLLLEDLPSFRTAILRELSPFLEETMPPRPEEQTEVPFGIRFMLAATATACLCGQRHGLEPCRCTPAARRKHWRTVPGSFLDRLEIQVSVQALRPDELNCPPGESSREVARRVRAARSRQRRRQGARLNSLLPAEELPELAEPDAQARKLLEMVSRRVELSTRSLHQTKRIARTVADLAGSERIRAPHMAEAVQYVQGASWLWEDVT
ncbi:MAG: ATP-binding protein [Thermoanaerobaculia bacterium]